MNKLAAVVLAILLACGAGLWFFAASSLNEFVKQQIISVGHHYTEQQVNVGKVDIKLSEGQGTIGGLTIGNPSSFSQPSLFSLGNILLDIDIASLAADPIVIETINITDATAAIEFNNQGDTNIQSVLDAINKKLPKSSGDTAPPASQQNEPNIRVNKVILSGIGLTVDLSQLGNKAHQKTLPTITLTDVGGDKGLPASQLGATIAKEIADNLWQQAKETQKEQLKSKVTEKIKEKASKELGKLFDKLKN